MKSKEILNQVHCILEVIEKNRLLHNNHYADYDFFREKFTQFELFLKNGDAQKIAELCYWAKWYAPRIIFEGTGNKELLHAIEKLNSLFEATPS
jgi:hypothetical protein